MLSGCVAVHCPRVFVQTVLFRTSSHSCSSHSAPLFTTTSSLCPVTVFGIMLQGFRWYCTLRIRRLKAEGDVLEGDTKPTQDSCSSPHSCAFICQALSTSWPEPRTHSLPKREALLGTTFPQSNTYTYTYLPLTT